MNWLIVNLLTPTPDGLWVFLEIDLNYDFFSLEQLSFKYFENIAFVTYTKIVELSSSSEMQ